MNHDNPCGAGLRALALALALTLAPGAHGEGAHPSDATLAALIIERLQLMPAVAAHKWHHRLPIEVPERETAVLAAARRDALRLGLQVGPVADFMTAQMTAAKALQRHSFERWAAGAAVPEAPDLDAVLRPRLIELGSAILRSARHSALRDGDLEPLLKTGLDPALVARLEATAQRLVTYPDRLTQILDGGVLRVGTTGDYPPFSHRPDGPTATYAGIDIDLARDLATSLGVTLELVATSWPTLLEDLAAGHWDIAMSGVSRTLQRLRTGTLSRGYHSGGKAPIARCDRAAGFGDLAAIDRPDVRVIVNPGGTNEAFVDGRLRQARKVIHEDNRTIFDALMAGRADVMITDRIEVTLMHRRHPELCATMGTNLSYQEKAYLLPVDWRWLHYVDSWLALRLADGTLDRTFERQGLTRTPVAGAR